MKSAVLTFTAALAMCASVIAFAQQTNAPLTRAQVRSELIQIENAGYHPASRDTSTYPSDIQAAEARVAEKNAANPSSDSGMGTPTGGASQSGKRIAQAPGSVGLFAHH